MDTWHSALKISTQQKPEMFTKHCNACTCPSVLQVRNLHLADNHGDVLSLYHGVHPSIAQPAEWRTVEYKFISSWFPNTVLDSHTLRGRFTWNSVTTSLLFLLKLVSLVKSVLSSSIRNYHILHGLAYFLSWCCLTAETQTQISLDRRILLLSLDCLLIGPNNTQP